MHELLTDIMLKIDAEMWLGEEINDDVDRSHNRALRIAKAIVADKMERLYGRERV